MRYFILCFFCFSVFSEPVVNGIDIFFEDGHVNTIKNKKIALLTNHTGVDKNLNTTVERFHKEAKDFSLVAIFSPEHGINGNQYGNEKIENTKYNDIKIYSLYGETRRPTKEMLKNIDIIFFDMQDIGTRAYSYVNTLFYVMEEAAKNNVSVYVLDRPNPMGGNIVDGPMLEEKYRSFMGYINVPYCHGMTAGELAKYFNEEYNIKCDLTVIPMKGWKRKMNFKQTKLSWVPPSPNIPEATTAYYYPVTGILGELKIANIGIGYTLPFKIFGAPWINAEKFAQKLNEQKLKGVKFLPFHFKPFYGRYKNENCQGVIIVITSEETFQPLSVQYLLIGILKSMYPKEFMSRLEDSNDKIEMFCKANGTDQIYKILKTKKYPAWELIGYDKEKRKEFLQKRKKYLIYE